MADAPHNLVADVMLGGVVLLGAALIAVLLFRRLGLGAVLGYLVAGIAIGPDGLGLIGAPETIMAYSEIGIILLLFLVGLELSPSRLWLLRRDIFLFGPLQVILCGLGMFAVVHFAMPSFSWEAALVLGLPLALSSTAQVLPLLQSRGRMKTDYGEKSFSILLFQDISIVPMLTIVAALSRAPALEDAIEGWTLALYAVLAIVALVLAGRYLLSPLLRLVGKISERELFIVTGLFTVCVSAAVMQAIGVSPALGAFVAGVMLADSPYRHELEADIDPFRSILLGLFFLAVGMLLDVDVILAQPLFVASLALALVAVKITVIFALGRFFGLKSKQSIIMAMLLSQGGEFAFVLFTAAQQALLIEPEAGSLFGAVVTLSMATTPFLMIIAGKLAARTGKEDVQLDDPALASQANVIIVGHGRFGQQVSQIMQAAGRSVTLIDINPQTIDLSNDFGFKVFYGDGTRVDLLKRAGGEDAQAIFFCIDDRYVTAESLIPVRETFPRTKLFVRAFDREQGLKLMEDDGISIMREVFESSIRMSADALKYFGTDREVILDIIAEFRRRDRSRLKAQFNSGDMHAGTRHSFGGDDSDDFLITQD
ncbi:MAG: monovalent cation:proton antiporter-2 (CPA2) family protein [Sphingorhabdus sp.]|jgi:glutathione-regulated potassium-efflux system protein KefB|uniref:monovalent cation:proton antiporter-2 (CPA2) family protein n=1 Tax=Sphingorhabdus sp. TaxID=1902408 RepID=UPI00273FE3E5|nr:monovalent cation:proton antiporter-2 (CPA2) family protein [Sphingorhabdus sp.]MDP4757910.1 monovalent cation:proton antiporter-2 (CPA2) family protein [Sphingorhabdus sp.]MDP4873086.1 monovalent cation:proton antiporter-2 (CPA2) family protein [Sphingorhabdus sp.]MDP4927942.1 monovalent cation:proton antiporter-2 (CPA2) family protein [Sphingorhabdus sp.]